MPAKVWIGTSGFYYEHWRGVLYPEKLAKSHWFEFFTQKFDTVEMNSTFYHLPKAKTVEHWDEKSPENFLFSFKISRVVTHYKKLQDVRSDLYLFLHLLKPLHYKIAAILVQLPPSLHKDLKLLTDFLDLLPAGWPFVIEFRHESWYEKEIYELLAHYGVAYCWHDYGRKEIPTVPTADFVYIRLHGPSGHYQGSYDDESLRLWAGRIRDSRAQNREVFVYFNNDMEGNAVRDAWRLREILGEVND